MVNNAGLALGVALVTEIEREVSIFAVPIQRLQLHPIDAGLCNLHSLIQSCHLLCCAETDAIHCEPADLPLMAVSARRT